MTLEERVGQLVMVDFSDAGVTPGFQASLARHHWGGVILFARNLKSSEQASALCASLQRARGNAPPLFIGVDQEGGVVDRLPFDALASAPGAMALGATGIPDLAARTAFVSGRRLRDLGFNVNFAPCVDVNNNPLNPVIGIRSYGESADLVSRFAVAAARGYRAAGVIPCAKHFPGHGDTSLDSHLSLPVVPWHRARLEEVELLPYRALICDGVEMIMTAHIVYPALDPQNVPATLSEPVLSGLLRRELGFEGVIITDSMSMKAIADHYGVGPAAVMAIEAGADIVLACGSHESQVETVEALLGAVRNGTISEVRLDASLRRIARLKQATDEAGRWTCPHPIVAPAEFLRDPRAREIGAVAALAARAAITLLRSDGTLPIERSRRVSLFMPTLLPVSQLGEIAVPFPLRAALAERGLDVSEHTWALQDEERPWPESLWESAGSSGGGSPDERVLPSLADLGFCNVGADVAGADVVVLCLYARGRLSAFQRLLAAQLTRHARALVVVSLNSPYVLADVSDAGSFLCTYGYAGATLEALADVLCGREKPQGRLPVTLPGLCERGHGLCV